MWSLAKTKIIFVCPVIFMLYTYIIVKIERQNCFPVKTKYNTELAVIIKAGESRST